jgi:hypothetical protein
MAFTANTLTAFANGNALAAGDRVRQLFYYQSADAQATIAAADYFLANYLAMGVGDIIFVVGAANGARTLSSYVVLTCSSTTVVLTKAA